MRKVQFNKKKKDVGVQCSAWKDKYNIHSIAHAHTNRKDEIFMQRQQQYIDEAHMMLDIFCFVIFFNVYIIFIILLNINPPGKSS